MEMKLNSFDNDFIKYNKQKEKQESKKLSFYLGTRITFYILLIFFAIFFIWFTVFGTIHSFYAVKGASMKGTLNASIADTDRYTSVDAVYVNKNEKPQIFDIVVIERESKESIIKRAMAFEGDYITIAKGTYEQSGETFDTFYFYRISAQQMKTLDTETFVDEDARLVEDGQNGYSIYSYKQWESKEENTILNYESKFYNKFIFGAASEDLFVSNSGLIYVKVPKGKIFAMGDNRAHSSDSRENGFYSLTDVVGRVDIVIYNHNFASRLWEVVKFYFSEAEKFFAR